MSIQKINSSKTNKKYAFMYLLFVLYVALCFISIFLKTNEIKDQQNIVNTFAQIQITIVALVITMLSITTTMCNDDMYGVKIKDILKLRKGFTLNLLNTIIILMFFLL